MGQFRNVHGPKNFSPRFACRRRPLEPVLWKFDMQNSGREGSFQVLKRPRHALSPYDGL